MGNSAMNATTNVQTDDGVMGEGESTLVGLRFHRHFTTQGVDPLDQVEWVSRSSLITNPDGSVVFRADDVEVPTSWSQLATDIVASKYFRKAGVNGGAETSVRQVVSRVAKTIRQSGEEQGGYFATLEDADTFEAELTFFLVNQYGAFNSPVWFNVGLFHQYGITGAGQSYAWREGWEGGEGGVERIENAYSRPQSSACFLQSVGDSLASIMQLATNEAMLYKYGSGTGSNFDNLRGSGEQLSGGGTSSGLMSWLKLLDSVAGSIKSGGTTRRAASMRIVSLDHPDVVDFIHWKVREEHKAKTLIAAGFPADFNGEAYATVSGQNSNNSVFVNDKFMTALANDGDWSTIYRTTKEVANTYKAKDIWGMIAKAAWECADPGVQFDTTINKWHTVPNSGKINTSNPCAEFVHLDDTACNLASINLTHFLRPNGTFDVQSFRYAVRVFFVAQEILVDLASYPTPAIARNSHDFRPLGLGYANLGTLLMKQGLAYDSDAGRALAGAITAIMTGHAYYVSSEMARCKGAFDGFAKNREPMLNVIGMHKHAANELPEALPNYLREAAEEDWARAEKGGMEHGYRNAQSTLLAPTGTVGLLMDCDTTGVEPDFALVKFKKLAGGGRFKIVNGAVDSALWKLGYTQGQISAIQTHMLGTGDLDHLSPYLSNPLHHTEILAAKLALRGAFDLESCFSARVIGEDAYRRLGVPTGGSLLRHIGMTESEIAYAQDIALGYHTIENAPYIRPADLSVFDCANRCGKHGTRFIAPIAHLRMMAAVQPFLSGAISKTCNVPNESTVEDIANLYMEGWRLGLKSVAIYRDGSKGSQPLSSGGEKKSSKKTFEERWMAPQPPEGRPLSLRLESTLLQIVESAVKDSPEADETVPPFVEQMSEPYKKALRSVVRRIGKLVGWGEDEQPTIPSPPLLSPNPTDRLRLPPRRYGITQEARVGGHKIFVRTGEYANGQLGEIFIDMHKEGAAFRSLMNCFAISISLGLQHGIPLQTFVDQFTFTRFEPQGMVEDDPNIKLATSIVDYIFRFLAVNYLGRHELAHVKPEPSATDVGVFRAMNAHVQRAPGAVELSEIGKHMHALVDVVERGREGNMSALDAQLDELMGDAPLCECGHMTVRNGACFRCLECGSSMGCS